MPSVSGPAQEWTTLNAAQRIVCCGPAVIYSAATRGEITVDVVPGCPPRYLLSDVRRLAESRKTHPRKNRPAVAGA